ncbi:hypothetical protein BDV95DRAFT_607801 [Massariosphaeria phaeospora]|uniref:Uncharacterized protein n=1 Tax=Massariosphaeria phaeospora TaxID=100035 RepID=A0A7C8I8B2_9PLEO|nr:hypothetical protein BDV95DRAFT_607801 [Massariosphaeria phaeospora]
MAGLRKILCWALVFAFGQSLVQGATYSPVNETLAQLYKLHISTSQNACTKGLRQTYEDMTSLLSKFDSWMTHRYIHTMDAAQGVAIPSVAEWAADGQRPRNPLIRHAISENFSQVAMNVSEMLRSRHESVHSALIWDLERYDAKTMDILYPPSRHLLPSFMFNLQGTHDESQNYLNSILIITHSFTNREQKRLRVEHDKLAKVVNDLLEYESQVLRPAAEFELCVLIGHQDKTFRELIAGSLDGKQVGRNLSEHLARRAKKNSESSLEQFQRYGVEINAASRKIREIVSRPILTYQTSLTFLDRQIEVRIGDGAGVPGAYPEAEVWMEEQLPPRELLKRIQLVIQDELEPCRPT